MHQRGFSIFQLKKEAYGWARSAVSRVRSFSSEHSDSNRNSSAESISITPREKDYSQWFLDVIAAAQMAENSPVKGCMIIRPWGMAIWDAIRDELNVRIKATGAENAYFPLFIPLSFISKVGTHIKVPYCRSHAQLPERLPRSLCVVFSKLTATAARMNRNVLVSRRPPFYH